MLELFFSGLCKIEDIFAGKKAIISKLVHLGLVQLEELHHGPQVSLSSGWGAESAQPTGQGDQAVRHCCTVLLILCDCGLDLTMYYLYVLSRHMIDNT